MTRVSAKEKIAKVALARFHQRGYQAMGIDQIIAEAGVSKGSFYHAFKSKEDLALEVLDTYYAARREKFVDGDYRFIEDALERCLAFVDHIAEVFPMNSGCFMGNSAIELARTSEKSQKHLATLFEGTRQELAQFFSPLAQEYDRVDADQLAMMFHTVMQGAAVQAQGYGDPERGRAAVRGFKDYLKAITS